MGYLEMFDQDFIEEVDPIDKWIRANNVDVKDTSPIPYQVVQQDLENDFRNDDNE
jgi:hypothetical protein